MKVRHECHALGCTSAVDPRLFMCLRHWQMLKRDMQRLIWATYRPGQETDKRPSGNYLLASAVCRLYVAMREGRTLTAELQAVHDKLFPNGVVVP